MIISNIVSFYEGYLKSHNIHSLKLKPGFTSNSSVKTEDVDVFWASQNLVIKKTAEMLKKSGNTALKNGDTDRAVSLYKRAIEIKPDYPDVYFNLGKAYKTKGQYTEAISTYERLLKINPHDLEAITNLGECHMLAGNLPEAKNMLNKALQIDPKYDLANRILLQTENLKLSQINPALAKEKEEQYTKASIQSALELISKYLPKDTLAELTDIIVVFGKTKKMDGEANIAQYENNQRRIVITEDYKWAAPEIIAAYIVHEAVHAKDRDAFTSVKEEQDAYKEAVKFWLIHNNGVKDPEMDYAAGLYLVSQQNLDEKVAEIYSKRDGSIPQYSPNHGLANISLANFALQAKSALRGLFASEESLKQAQIIAEQGLYSNSCR